MGECVYYMKAVWPDAKAAEAALPKVDAFLKRMAQAEDQWQETRHWDEGMAREMWAKLAADFPDVIASLQIVPPEDSREFQALNFLAGQLDSPASSGDYEIYVLGKELRFSGTVWHFADWTGLADALKKQFGAERSGWTSEEYATVSYFDEIGMS